MRHRRRGTRRLAAVVLSTLLALTSVSGVLAAPSRMEAILGSWDVMTRETAGMTVAITMKVEKNRITMASRCSHRDDAVVAVVSSPAEITEDRIRILETSTQAKEHSPGYLNCKATIKPMTVSYEIQAGKLLFHDSGTGKTMTFTRSAAAD